ncbi:MAG: hypothetical protein U0Y68_18430 [Blastocatellia bacterium]
MASLGSLFSKLLPRGTNDYADDPQSGVPAPATPASRPRRALPTAPAGEPPITPDNAFDPRAALDALTSRPVMPDLPTYTPHENHGFGERIIGFFRGGRQGGLAGALEGATHPEKQEYQDWVQTKYAPVVQQRQMLDKEANEAQDRKIKSVEALTAMTTALANQRKSDHEINKPEQMDKGTEIGYVDKKTNKFVPYLDSEGKPLTHSSVATAQINSTARMSEAGLQSQTQLILQKQKDAVERYKIAEESARAKAKSEAEYKQAMDVAHVNLQKELANSFFNAGASTPDETMFTPSEEEIFNYQQANKVDRANAIEGARRTKREKYYRETRSKNPANGLELFNKVFGGSFK